MKFEKYNRRLFSILIVVLLCLGGFNWIVDPFERNGRVDFGLPKGTVSQLLSYQMYKIFLFLGSPQTTVVLGDSRSLALQEDFFQECGNPNVFNFAYGGGTLYEAIDTFWFASENTNIQRVILGVPFSIFNEANSMNRFPTAREVTKNPLSYYLSPLVTKASVYNLLTWSTGLQFASELPDMSRDEFWEYQLGPGTDRFYATWKQPEVLWSRLVEVSEYCSRNNIELVVFIPPSHTDQQKLIVEYGLQVEYREYKRQLSEIGRVFDYDVASSLTEDRDNFLDPRHCSAEVARMIVGDLLNQLSE